MLASIAFPTVNEASADAPPGSGRAGRRDLRRRLLAERDAFVARPEAGAATAALATTLRAVVRDLEPDCLGLYWPVRSEFNAAAALAADAGGAEFARALPYARRTPRTMEFRRWDGASPSLADECGIGSSAGAVVVPDVVIVPCVGFTASGYRLGYGGGYYDRWLAAHPEVTSVGVGWSFSELDADTFAPQPHDAPLGLVVTELGVR